MEHPQVAELRKKFGISAPPQSLLQLSAQQQQTVVLDASLTGMNSSTTSDRTNRTTSTAPAGSPTAHGPLPPSGSEPVRENSSSFQSAPSAPSTTPPSPSASHRTGIISQPATATETQQRQEVVSSEIESLGIDQIYAFAKETFLLLSQIGVVSTNIHQSGVNLPPVMRNARGGMNTVDSPRVGAQIGAVRSRQSSVPSTIPLSQEASHDELNFTGLHSRRESNNNMSGTTTGLLNQPSNTATESEASKTVGVVNETDPTSEEGNSISLRSATMPPNAVPPVELEIESASPRVLSNETLPPATSTHKETQSRSQSEVPSPSVECVSTNASTPGGASTTLISGIPKKDTGSAGGRINREDSLMSTHQGSDVLLGVSKATTMKSSTSHSSLVSHGTHSNSHLSTNDKANRLASETASSQGESPRKSLVNSQSPQGQSPPNFMVEGPSGTPHGVTFGQSQLMVMQTAHLPRIESQMLLEEMDPYSADQPMSYMQSMRMNPKAVETQDGFFETINDYVMMEEVGRGSYASVFKAAELDQQTGETKREVAIKRIPKSVFGRGRGDITPGASPAVTPAMKGLGVGISDAPPANLALDTELSSRTPIASVSAPHLAPPARKVMNNPNSAIQSGGILREIALMKKVKHENVMHLLECIYDPSKAYVYLVMPFAEGGPVLKQGSVKEQYEPIKEVTALGYLKQVARGLTFLHKHEIVHFDLKPDNILKRNDRLYIADFGMSNLVSVVNDQTTSGGASEQDLINQRFANLKTMGTPAFHCPEVGFMKLKEEVLTDEELASVRDTLTLTKDYDVKVVDIWALGVTFYLMLTGVLPFTKDPTLNLSDPELIAEQDTLLDATDKMYFLKYMQRIVLEDVFLPKCYKVSSKTRALLKKMLQRDPMKRSSAESILSNRVFRKRHQQHITEAKKLSSGVEVTPSPEPEGSKTNKSTSQPATNEVSPAMGEVVPEVQLPQVFTKPKTEDRSPEMEGPMPLTIPPPKSGTHGDGESADFTNTSGSGATDDHPLLTEIDPGLLSSGGSEPNTPGGQLLLSNDSILLSGDEYSPDRDGEDGAVPDWLSPKSMRAVDRSKLKNDEEMFKVTDEDLIEAVVTVNPSASIPRNFSSSAVFGAMLGVPSPGNSPLPGNSPSNQSNILPVQSGLSSLGGSSTALLAKPYTSGIEPPQRRRQSIPVNKQHQ